MNKDFIDLLSQANNDFNYIIVNELRNKGINDEKIDIIKQLYKNNKRLFSTLNLEFVKSEIFKDIEINLLNRIVSLEITQNEILSLDNKKRSLLLFMTNNYSKNSYMPAYFSALLKNLKGN